MKLIRWLLILLLPMGMLLFANCTDDDEDGSPYVIEFTIDGTHYAFTGGYNDVNGEPEGNDYNGTHSYVGAVPAGSANNDEKFVIIRVTGTTTGSYDETGDDNDINFSYCFNTSKSSWKDDTGTQDFTLKITKYEGVGGVMEGTFQGTVFNNQTSATANLTNGYFYVKRITDGSLTAPW